VAGLTVQYYDPGVVTSYRTLVPKEATLNPAMTTDELTKGNPWPPRSQKPRLVRYLQNKYLYAGQHQEVYGNWATHVTDDPGGQRALVLIVANFPGVLSRLVADLLFGEADEHLNMACENEAAQKAVERLVTENGLKAIAYENSGLGASYWGDCCYKVWLKKGLACIACQPPGGWFPVVSSGNIKEIVKHILAWDVRIGEQRYLRKETHTPGQIIHEAFRIDGSTIGAPVDIRKVLGETLENGEIEDTGIDEFLVVSAPNVAMGDELFGQDDYYEMDTIFAGLNILLARNDLVLAKHTDPNIMGPASQMEQDPDQPGKWRVRTAGKYFGMEPGDPEPKYLTWDGKLEAAFDQIDLMIRLLMYVSETSPACFGLDKDAVAESGTALKKRLMRTLAKVNRKRMYADEALKRVALTAQKLEAAHGKGGYTPERPSIRWADGLPDDPKEEAEITQLHGVDQVESRVQAIMREFGVDEETAQKWADKIQEERDAALPEFGRSGFEGVNLNDRRGQRQSQGGE
jgi:hypothetical protein